MSQNYNQDYFCFLVESRFEKNEKNTNMYKILTKSTLTIYCAFCYHNGVNLRIVSVALKEAIEINLFNRDN
jgi:hypothetical protein